MCNVFRIFSVNFKAIVNISQVVSKKMIESGLQGSIVAISSQASLAALPRHTAYGTIKAALDQLVRSMALELGPHQVYITQAFISCSGFHFLCHFQIRTNAVNPTVTKTEMFSHPAVGWDKPEKAKPMLDRIPLGIFAGMS